MDNSFQNNIYYIYIFRGEGPSTTPTVKRVKWGGEVPKSFKIVRSCNSDIRWQQMMTDDNKWQQITTDDKRWHHMTSDVIWNIEIFEYWDIGILSFEHSDIWILGYLNIEILEYSDNGIIRF